MRRSLFRDRAEAAHLLAQRLVALHGKHPLFVSVAGGGVPIARILADELGGDLDVVLARELRASTRGKPPLGSVVEGGEVVLEPGVRSRPSYLAKEVAAQTEELRRRRASLEGLGAPLDPRGRVTVVVADGVATGATVVAALRSLRARRPAWLMVAAAVASPRAAERLAQEADRVVFVTVPETFESVAEFFRDFREVDEGEVRQALARRPVRLRTG